MHGDISNGIPPRVLVHLDVVTMKITEEVRFLKFFKREKTRRVFDKVALAAMWRYAGRTGVLMDLFDFDMSQDEMDDLLDALDRVQAHPFRSGIVYPNVQALVTELPYRQDILGVVDLPGRGVRYGSRWIDLSDIK